MAKTIKIKQHDTKMVFTDTPKINDVALTSGDLAGCTLSFLMKDTATPPAKPPIKQTATINPDATFSYAPVATDVDTIGKFQQEWEVIFPGPKPLTFPNDSYNIVKIIADLG